MIRKRGFRVEGDTAFITLTKGAEAMIDAADISSVKNHSWFVSGNGRTPPTLYATASIGPASLGPKRMVRLQNFLLAPDEGMVVDHINGNPLDNRRKNLRICTPKENSRNKRKYRRGNNTYRGVSWYARSNRWRAYISVDGRQIHIGLFDDEEAAAREYDVHAKRLHGEFASLNFRDQS